KARTVLRYRLGVVREQKLREIEGAIDAYEEILGHGPHPESLQALERLVLDFDQRYRIAKILEPIYKAGDEWRKLVVIYDAELEFIPEKSDRVELLREIARIHESRGGDLKLAFTALARAFVEDPTHPDLHAELERLAAIIGAYDDLVAALEKGFENVLDTNLQAEILARIARTHEEKRGDPRKAIEAWR